MRRISFQPAFDVYHTCFRILRLQNRVFINIKYVEVDLLRILDFYLLFPYRMTELRFNQKERPLRKQASGFESYKTYGVIPESKVLFEEMCLYQTAAMQKLIDIGVFSQSNSLLLPQRPITDSALVARITEVNRQEEKLMCFLHLLAFERPFSGPDSLRVRSGLIDTRYDIEELP